MKTSILQRSKLALVYKFINPMNKLFVLSALASFLSLSCERDDLPNDVAARASGTYVIESYVVNGDTLYSTQGINRLSFSEFYIIVERKGPDSVRIGSVYQTMNGVGSHTYIKDVGISEINGMAHLSATTVSPQVYEGRIEGNTFYERAAKGWPSLLVLPPSYSVKPAVNPNLEGVIITARK